MRITPPHQEIIGSQEQGTQRWMLSYSDMVTLLLAFFVLFFAISQVDQAKFEAIMEYFSQSDKLPLHELEKVVNKLVDEHNLQQSVEVELTADGLLLTFQDKILFDSGKANLKERAFPILSGIGEILNSEKVANRNIKVEGHTDTVPLAKNSNYPSNWELSAARATHVIRYLINRKVQPQRFVAIGYADTRLRVPESGMKRGLQANRRVSLIIK
ncbi:MAG: flagellar motor protein MotB [Calditrichaeota bacterium]|nr:MAG: flagellar motor protein MotB [Calditrichota bacterium]